uniref:Uncharacterized protein n=1 Tax=Acrobeloides nanus TaxID=290746 RepID=A0A914BXZ3_9BILA
MSNTGFSSHSSAATLSHHDLNMARSHSQTFVDPCAQPPNTPTMPFSHSAMENLASAQTAPSSSIAGPSTAYYGRVPHTQETTPRSPKTGRVHVVPHKWETKRHPKFNSDKCLVCQKSIGFISSCERCRACKRKVHPECKHRVGDSCGLTPDHLKASIMLMLKASNKSWSPITIEPTINIVDMSDPNRAQSPLVVESSSSTNSSAPSTPAYINNNNRLPNLSTITYHQNHLDVAPRSAIADLAEKTPEKLFTFPDPRVPHIILPGSADDANESNSLTDSQGGFDSSMRIGSNDDSYDNDRTDSSQDGQNSESGGHKWDRRAWNMFTIRERSATSWSKVTIASSKIDIKELIGRGRFSEVYRGEHFGNVAVKFLSMDHVEEEKQIEAFKQEVEEFKNARHENIVYFYGYIMDPHQRGIVMLYIQGKPLHQLIHNEESLSHRYDFVKIIDFATQICQGMSYLHTKGILHKDLRSKNVFIEKQKKVVITDFSLFNIRRLAKPERKYTLVISEHWLSYLSPELIRSLRPDLQPLLLTEKSDVYAFGTIWYELLAYDFPFPKSHPDSLVYQVGRGMKTPLTNLNTTIKEAKMILMQCWAYQPHERPSFSEVRVLLEKLPRKRLRRSPSVPTALQYE